MIKALWFTVFMLLLLGLISLGCFGLMLVIIGITTERPLQSILVGVFLFCIACFVGALLLPEAAKRMSL